MSLLAPLFLLAGAALLVPLLLHLWRRTEVTTETFPALRYLLTSTREQDRILRIRHLLLLLLRLAVVALLVLAGARLVLPLGGRDHPPGAVVMIVDNSISSGLVAGGERTLDRLLEGGRQALAALGPADRVWLLTTGEPTQPAFPLTPLEADFLLGELESHPVAFDLERALRRADALLAAAGDGPSMILLLSDLRLSALPDPGDQEGGPAIRTPLLLVPADLPSVSHRGIGTVRIGGGLVPRAGDPSEVEVQVEGDETAGVPTRLFLEEELVAAGRTDAEGRVLFTLPPRESGWVEGWVELDPDALRADDRVPFGFQVRPAPTVGVAGEPPRFLAEALETLAEAGRIRRVPSDQASVRILPEGRLDPRGGPEPALRILIPPRDPTTLPALNRWLEEGGWEWRLTPPAAGEGTEARLEGADPFPASLEGLAVRRAYGLEGPAEGVLLRTSDGSPWLVEEEGDGRRLRILASSLDGEASDLPLSALLLPFLDRLLDPGSRGGGVQGTVEAGTPLPLPPGARQVRRPDGTQERTGGTRNFSRANAPGTYEFLDEEGGVVDRMVIRPAATPGDPLDPEMVAERLGPAARHAAEPVAWDREVLADRRGREVSALLAALAFLLLLVEGRLAAPGPLRNNSPR